MKKWKLTAQLKTGQIVKKEGASLSEALKTLSTNKWEKLVVKKFLTTN